MHPSWSRCPPGVEHRIVLLRHGEPTADSRGRCYGSLDVPLSESGRQQARATAAALVDIPFAAIYSSPLHRAFDTASVIAEPHGLPVRIEPDFAEMDFGALEGLTYSEIEQRWPELYAAWMNRPTEVEFPQGESFARLQARVQRAALALRHRHRRQVVFLATHGGVIRALLADALQLPAPNIFRLSQAHAGLTSIDWYGESPVVTTMNVVVTMAPELACTNE